MFAWFECRTSFQLFLPKSVQLSVVNYLVDFYLCWIIKNPADLRQVLGNRHLFRPPHRSNLGKKKRVPLDVCWLEIQNIYVIYINIYILYSITYIAISHHTRCSPPTRRTLPKHQIFSNNNFRFEHSTPVKSFT